jgi:predicted Fe-Mo cluster-binding NifX family protein
MKICIPALENKKDISKVSEHFGSAPYFIIYDSEGKSFLSINNSDKEHVHGQCNPVQSFDNTAFDVIVVNGIGERAMNMIKQKGIKVCKASAAVSVKDIIEQFEAGQLKELDDPCSCEGHGCK